MKVIVFGNEKGGTGKSTLAMHLVVSLLNRGFKVGSIDVDARQGTFSRYIENRQRSKDSTAPNILLPIHSSIFQSDKNTVEDMESENSNNFNETLEPYKDFDFVVIDTPGNDTNLSRIAHSHADVLITPLNESFIDLDLLVKLQDSVASSELKPSTYSAMVWEQKKNKAIKFRNSIDWVVLVNRMSNVASKNRQDFESVLKALSKRIGFRIATGFKERVIFRELFVSGLTLLDKEYVETKSLSHIAARHELAELLRILNIKTESEAAA